MFPFLFSLLKLKLIKYSAENNIFYSNKKNIVSILDKNFSNKLKTFFFELELVGLGYRASIKKSRIRLSLGYSHIVFLLIPYSVYVLKKKSKILVYSTNKSLLGTFVSVLLRFKSLNPYKLKGLKRKNLVYKLKPGKRSK
jgi:ribosomal protein L6P/L9E